ncbi:MAG TPA: helix-hairpin-helix domain-containing protein, partial [Actinomycetota bacterium]|nr:helix-hairpin-helix domain-containing protein [Actinomycetota bacterium]
MPETRYAKSLALVEDALQELQKKQRSVASVVRKLELCAAILDDRELQEWCAFHLGAYASKLKPVKGDDREGMDRLTKAVQDLPFEWTSEEVSARVLSSGGGFLSIEIIEAALDRLNREKRGNDGTFYRSPVARVISECANAAGRRAAKLYARLSFGDIPRRQFDVIRERVDDTLLEIAPEAVEKFMAAYERLASSSAEDWSLALTACRRVIKAVADAIYPPRSGSVNGRAVGEDQYINRLWAFLDENVATGSDKALAKAHADYLGSFLQRLNEKASKGVHASVTYEEAVRCVLYTYLTLGDILEFGSARIAEQLQSSGRLNINQATVAQLTNLPGITMALAKSIVKRRVHKPFASVDELAEVRGIGEKKVEALRRHVVAL